MKNKTFVIHTEKTSDNKKVYSVSGTLLPKTYYRMGPYKTKKEAQKYIDNLLNPPPPRIKE